MKRLFRIMKINDRVFVPILKYDNEMAWHEKETSKVRTMQIDTMRCILRIRRTKMKNEKKVSVCVERNETNE